MLYHTSNPYFRDKIESEGLIPKVGDSYFLHWQGELFNGKKVEKPEDLPKYVFLSKEPYDSTYDDDIWEIDESQLDKDYLSEDPGLSGALVYSKKIPRSAMKLVYQGKPSLFETILRQ